MIGLWYTPDDLIRRSDFQKIFGSMNRERQDRIRKMIAQFVAENPSYRISAAVGPAYFFMQYLIGDLYTALALYLTEKDDQTGMLAKIDEALVESGKVRCVPGVTAVTSAI